MLRTNFYILNMRQLNIAEILWMSKIKVYHISLIIQLHVNSTPTYNFQTMRSVSHTQANVNTLIFRHEITSQFFVSLAKLAMVRDASKKSKISS